MQMLFDSLYRAANRLSKWKGGENTLTACFLSNTYRENVPLGNRGFPRACHQYFPKAELSP